jgi:hypothetical protein
MKSQDKKQLSSKQLLEQIGFSALPDSSLGLMDEDDGMDGYSPLHRSATWGQPFAFDCRPSGNGLAKLPPLPGRLR